ncbi:hypothetical protein LXA43DRAFT_660850 [Ganoderma leucocontextum]|nr:hypothetical protein LXA43DRAFT_660850 [Ganoderma leucocontextum]
MRRWNMGLVLIANLLPSDALGESSVAPGAAGFELRRRRERGCAVKHSVGSLVHFAARSNHWLPERNSIQTTLDLSAPNFFHLLALREHLLYLVIHGRRNCCH